MYRHFTQKYLLSLNISKLSYSELILDKVEGQARICVGGLERINSNGIRTVFELHMLRKHLSFGRLTSVPANINQIAIK